MKNNRFRMSRIGFFSIINLLLLLLLREIDCNKIKVNNLHQLVQATKESNPKKKKFTKFDNKVVGDIKTQAERSTENEDETPIVQVNREFNLKNSTFVKLWLSDIELKTGGLSVFGDDISSIKGQKSPGEEQEEFKINEIIEENRLLDKLNLLRQYDTEVADSGEISSFDDVTRKKILASGINISSQKSDTCSNQETQQEVIKSVETLSVDVDDDEEPIILITPGQQIAALEILTGKKLIHTIQLSLESDEVLVESKNLIEPTVGFEYEEKSFLECVEIKKNLIQKIGKLKLENANLSLNAQRLRNKERKTKEYRLVLANIERNKANLHNQNIELLKIERRIQQLSAEDGMEDSVQSEAKTELSQDNELALRKRERRKVIIAAILEEAKRRKLMDVAAKRELMEEENKKAEKTVEENEQIGGNEQIKANEQIEERQIEEKAPEMKSPSPREKLQESEMSEIRSIAKMLVWLQENSSKISAGIETRKERGATAVKSLTSLYISDKAHFEKVSEKIKNNFERKVLEKNQKREK